MSDDLIKQLNELAAIKGYAAPREAAAALDRLAARVVELETERDAARATSAARKVEIERLEQDVMLASGRAEAAEAALAEVHAALSGMASAVSSNGRQVMYYVNRPIVLAALARPAPAAEGGDDPASG